MKHYKHVIYAQIIVHNVEVTLTVINVYKDFIVKMEIVFNAQKIAYNAINKYIYNLKKN